MHIPCSCVCVLWLLYKIGCCCWIVCVFFSFSVLKIYLCSVRSCMCCVYFVQRICSARDPLARACMCVSVHAYSLFICKISFWSCNWRPNYASKTTRYAISVCMRFEYVWFYFVCTAAAAVFFLS